MFWCYSTVSNRRMHFAVSSLRGKLGGLYACGATFRYNLPLLNIFLTRLFSKTRLKSKDFQEIARLTCDISVVHPKTEVHLGSKTVHYRLEYS